MRFSGEKFGVADDSPRPVPPWTGLQIAGVWSESASSPWGLSAGTTTTNAGYYSASKTTSAVEFGAGE